MGALMNRDAEARRDELYGFDYMDKDGIEPIVEAIDRLSSARRHPESSR